MNFGFTQMRRTLKKNLVGIGFEHVTMSKHSHQGFIATEVETDLFDPK